MDRPRAWNGEAVRLAKTGFPWLRAMTALYLRWNLTYRDHEKNLLNLNITIEIVLEIF